MDNSQQILQGQIGIHMENIIDIVNSKEDNAEKAVLLKQLWSVFYGLNDDIQKNINYVGKKVVSDFFAAHSRYNDFLSLVEGGSGCWMVLSFGIPICVISCSSKEAGFYSMDSIRDELARFERRHQENAEKTRKSHRKIDEILSLSDWQIFIHDLKRKSFITPSLISKGRENLRKMNQTLSDDLSRQEGKYQQIHEHKESFVAFINEISAYLYAAFEEDGFVCSMKDIEPHCYDFEWAISLFIKRDELRGTGLAIKDREEYPKQEKLSLGF